MSFVDLKEYHDGLVGELRDVVGWLKDGNQDSKAAAVKLKQITEEVEAAFHAMQMRLTGAYQDGVKAARPGG